MFYFPNFFHFNFFMVPPHLYPHNQQFSFVFNHHVHIAIFLTILTQKSFSPHIKNTQLIYNNTNNKNIFYHYIFHKTYTHTILISSNNQAYYILPKLAIDSKAISHQPLIIVLNPTVRLHIIELCILYLKIIMIQRLDLPRSA
jgi:hypothetical protein